MFPSPSQIKVGSSCFDVIGGWGGGGDGGGIRESSPSFISYVMASASLIYIKQHI